MFNTVMTPLFQQHAKVDVIAIAVLPTPVLWFVKHFRQDVLAEIARTQPRDRPNIREFLDQELSRRGIDLRSCEGPRGYEHIAEHCYNQHFDLRAARRAEVDRATKRRD